MQNRKFLEQIDNAYAEIQKAKDNYTQELEKFFEPFKENIDIFISIWEQRENEIEKQLNEIADNLDYKFSGGYTDELSFYKIMSDIVDMFPIKNYDNSFIDTESGLESTWIIESKSDNKIIHITFNPIQERSRYPVDPEENPDYFEYRLPVNLHEENIKTSKDKKEQLLTQYFEETVAIFLENTKQKILTKKKLVEGQLSGIDFNDPEILKELRSRLNK